MGSPETIRSRKSRPIRLDKAALDYAPENELGVVYLFASEAKRRFGLRVEKIQQAFPDCIASRHGEKIRIEFEYRSRSFALHKHDHDGCDWIVCWIHDWPDCPSHIQVVELRKVLGKGFNVWVVPIGGEFREILGGKNADDGWSVPSQAGKGDLVLFYRTKPDGYIADLFKLTGAVRHEEAGWKSGRDYLASINRVTRLSDPVFFVELRRHPCLQTAGFVRSGMRARCKVTPHWPDLYQMIIDKNPQAVGALRKFGPGRLD